jgi:hypothetical protein
MVIARAGEEIVCPRVHFVVAWFAMGHSRGKVIITDDDARHLRQGAGGSGRTYNVIEAIA